jgi:hypothetical protein
VFPHVTFRPSFLRFWKRPTLHITYQFAAIWMCSMRDAHLNLQPQVVLYRECSYSVNLYRTSDKCRILSSIIFISIDAVVLLSIID